MASRIYQAFVIGILCIALILTSGPTIVKAREAYHCEFPCLLIGGPVAEGLCNKRCLGEGMTRGGTCRNTFCCCRYDS
ncbi:unnamed protein product [Lupinus luteus]|uniref:Uncharacterized protein n=1 Tax=Lupinus luteus TaxID=3873 RepID=A0AAV1W0H7_LUPLU